MPIRAILYLSILVHTALLAGAQKNPLDEVHLKNGQVIEGRLVSDTPTKVVVELSFGGTVELRRGDIVRVMRRLGKRAGRPESGRRVVRFLLYHGSDVVGLRTVTHSWGVRRQARVGELWHEEIRFYPPTADVVDEPECRIETIEFASADGEFRQIYHRVSDVAGERIVDGRWREGRLAYTLLEGGERSHHEARIDPSVRFPTEQWFATNRAEPGKRLATQVWDPTSRRLILATVRAHEPTIVPLEGRQVRVRVVESAGARGRRVRWVADDGAVMRETMNGRALIAVATSRERMPSIVPGERRPDRAERQWLRVVIDTDIGAVLRLPSLGWLVERPEPGVFSIVNAELEATITIHWRAESDGWPGPQVPEGDTEEPVRVGAWGGTGWEQLLEDGTRQRVVRRRAVGDGRLVAVLDAPLDMLGPARIDLRALLTESRFGGR